MKNRIACLVIYKNDKSSFLYTDIRKVKSLIKTCKDLEVFIFKHTSSGNWDDIYVLSTDSSESKINMFNDESTYSELGYLIMESLAKAEWNSSIKYPDNGWHICSICNDITNEIDTCWYCEEYVCWNCANEATNLSWEDDGHYCSYDCYRKYLEQEHGIKYNPEGEYKQKICNRLGHILEYFEKEEIIDILVKIEMNTIDFNIKERNKIETKYEDMVKKELLNILNHKCDEDVYNILIELYKNETEEYLSDILDGESFINNLDPNDPADAWFFED